MRKKKIILIFICIVIAAAIVIGSLYVADKDFRENFDRYILRKEVREENSKFILLDEEKSVYLCSYGKYIGMIAENTLKVFNKNSYKAFEIEIDIESPVTDSSEQFLIVGEEQGQKVYLIQKDKIIWEKELEGELAGVTVNKNGYAAIWVKQTTYQNVLMLFDDTGEELFKKYFATSFVMDVSISNDNKYIAIAEANTDGTQIETKLELIAIETVKSDVENAVVWKIEGIFDSLAINVEIQEKNKVIVMFDNQISVITDAKIENLADSYENIIFAGIDLNDSIYRVKAEEASIIHTSSSKIAYYKLLEYPKQVTSKKNTIAIHTGAEVHFISPKGTLVKNYISQNEVKSVTIGDGIAGILYRNKVVIIKL